LPKVKDWFSGWITSNNTVPEKPSMFSGTNHWAALLPESLYKRRESLTLSQDVQDKVEPLEDTYTVEFSGGGGLMEFHMEHHHESESTHFGCPY
jgi:hypothetical protein